MRKGKSLTSLLIEWILKQSKYAYSTYWKIFETYCVVRKQQSYYSDNFSHPSWSYFSLMPNSYFCCFKVSKSCDLVVCGIINTFTFWNKTSLFAHIFKQHLSDSILSSYCSNLVVVETKTDIGNENVRFGENKSGIEHNIHWFHFITHVIDGQSNCFSLFSVLDPLLNYCCALYYMAYIIVAFKNNSIFECNDGN